MAQVTLALLLLVGAFSLHGVTSPVNAREQPAREDQPVNVEAVAVVQRMGQEEFCSGALVSDSLVLTALHCIQEVGEPEPHSAGAFRVGFGPSLQDPELHWVGVREIRVPGESYAESAEDLKGNDIAILILEPPVGITPFPIPGQTPLPKEGTQLTIFGFGEDRYGYVGKRHTTQVRVTERTETGFTFEGGGCRGGSGGPILDRKGRLIGLISLGTTRHCIPEKTRYGQPLAPYSDFITDQLLRVGRSN